MKITREQLKQIIKEELEEVASNRAEPATEYELYSEFLAVTRQLQEFRDNLDFAMGLTASATRQSQLSDEVYEMIRKASFALDTARTKFAQEIGQDPAPELRPVRENKRSSSQLSGIGFEIDDLINKTTRLLIDTEMDADMKSTAIGIVDQIRDDVKKRYRQLAYYVGSATKKGPSAKERELDEAGGDKKSPDDIVARFPSSRPGEPDQVIYRWQQEEFDERERALKAFNKRKKK